MNIKMLDLNCLKIKLKIIKNDLNGTGCMQTLKEWFCGNRVLLYIYS